MSIDEYRATFPFVKVICSRKEEADRLISEAVDYFHTLKAAGCIGPVDEFDFRLVLDEAVDNAICHGNHFNPEKKVMVVIKEIAESIHILVRDDGNGFSHGAAYNRAMKRQMHDQPGRGLRLISSIGTVKWNDAGNCIKIELL